MRPIGGYFELEINKKKEYHTNCIRLNTGRNAFEYILLARKYKKVFLPYYTCDVMFEPIEKLNLDYEFYSISERFDPILDFDKLKIDEVCVYTNYFGLCDEVVKRISKLNKNIIIDNSQAFFSRPINNVDTLYSPRKFFGIPDGAYLFTDTKLAVNFKQDISINRYEHLLGRIDIGAEMFYEAFKKNEDSLIGQPIMRMSKLTMLLLESIHYKEIAKKRYKNFWFLHKFLMETNEFSINSNLEASPLCYPYLTSNSEVVRDKLLTNKIFTPVFWPNLANDIPPYERYLQKNLIPLPIDQRCNNKQLKYIIETINSKDE